MQCSDKVRWSLAICQQQGVSSKGSIFYSVYLKKKLNSSLMEKELIEWFYQEVRVK